MADGGGMIAGPGSRENGGSAHCSAHGLLAYGAGSCVVVVDVRSMQLVVVLPMPAPQSSPPQHAPYVTALQWNPEPMTRDLLHDMSLAHLRLAVGDRHGRLAIWDAASKSVHAWLELDSDRGRLGIQDVCWIFGAPWLLAAIHGSTLFVIWDPQSQNAVWKYDSGYEYLGCVRCDPFDSRQVCVVGLRGLLLTLLVQGTNESDIGLKVYEITVSEERNSGQLGVPGQGAGGKDAGSNSGSTSAGAPALAASPGVIAQALFSPRTRGLLYLLYTREIVVFDSNFGMTLGSTPMPRGLGKLLDIVAVAEGDILYCAHQDCKLTAWTKKEGEQVFTLSMTESLIPSMGSSGSAGLLAAVHCPLQVQQVGEGKHPPTLQLPTTSLPGSSLSPIGQLDSSRDVKESGSISKFAKEIDLLEVTFVSVTDDGKLWQWKIGSRPELDDSPTQSPRDKAMFKLELVMQLQMLPSPITTLAVPVPSQLAIVTGGGGAGAVAVPLVALATQSGTLELVDPASNAITSSFMVHNNAVVRGVRWLGNSRLASFSFVEVKGKGGGFVNKVAVTCVRSGQTKPFRVLRKPERGQMRALRASPSGRYLLILFREAPSEVWAMTRTPQMLRSLALPFTVMEWALPPAVRSPQPSRTPSSSRRSSSLYGSMPTIASTAAAASAAEVSTPKASQTSTGGTTVGSELQAEADSAESFAFALVNGSLGVFEIKGRRVRDFRPKWPTASFVSSDVLVTAMAYRMPHVVMGDRIGNIRWWDVTTGQSSLFNTHRGGIRRIKFAPVAHGDWSRGRVAVLFSDHTFAVFDLDTQDPVANAIVPQQYDGILVLELDWFPLRADKNEPLLLCIAGADGSFRVREFRSSRLSESGSLSGRSAVRQQKRPVPLCSPALIPPAHAMAFKMLLQLGVRSSWFYETPATGVEATLGYRGGDLRGFLLETSLPQIGEVVTAEILLKSLEAYRRAGRLLDSERVMAYGNISKRGIAARAAFAAAHFGEYAEAAFWLQLPTALALLSAGSAGHTAFWNDTKESPPQQQPQVQSPAEIDAKVERLLGSRTNSKKLADLVPSPTSTLPYFKMPFLSPEVIPGEKDAVSAAARERISWHEKLTGREAIQKRVHEFVAVGDFESAVPLLLSTPPGDENFYLDALRAVSLAAAVSPALHELAVKVVAANMQSGEDSLAGTHLLCAVGRYQEACTQLQDAGRWVDANTLAAAHLRGSAHARVLERWAEHVLLSEHNLWRAMILFVAAGALSEALTALRNAQLPETSALFLLACHEAKGIAVAESDKPSQISEKVDWTALDLPGNLNNQMEGVWAVCEYFGQYQRMLSQVVTDIQPIVD